MASRPVCLFTCDPYSKILDPADKNTALLFGDAATVTLLADEGKSGTPPWSPVAFRFRTMGQRRRCPCLLRRAPHHERPRRL